MSAETALYSLLSGTSGITTLTSTRIYPDAMPEGISYPAIVFSRTETAPIPSIHGSNFGADVTLSIGCWAETRTAADAVAIAVNAAIIHTAFVPTGRESVFDSETGLFAGMLIAEYYEAP